MALAINGDFQKAGGAERLPDRAVTRIAEDRKVAGTVKEQARRGQCAVL